MQPLYQIPGEMFAKHVERLSRLPSVAACPSRLHALLFLSGLRVAFRYYRAASGDDEFFTNFAPSHRLEDGLSTAARRCLGWLVERARSRDTRDTLRTLGIASAPGWKWVALSVSFAAFPTDCPRTVRDWIARSDAETSLVRLSGAMGIEALWQTNATAFVHPMMREPLNLAGEEFAAIEAFTLTKDTALPEL